MSLIEAKAEELFMSGYNCSQSVFGALADGLGVDKALAMKLASGLGGGVGRMREVCGAVTGATLALGIKFGPDKHDVYPRVQKLCERFKNETGSIVCRELLSGTGATTGGKAEARTDEYYHKRPCVELVKLAAHLAAEELSQA